MKDLFGNNKFRQMIFFVIVGILVIGLITAITKGNSETLSDYARNNPEAAYAETDNSWTDAYHTQPSE